MWSDWFVLWEYWHDNVYVMICGLQEVNSHVVVNMGNEIGYRNGLTNGNGQVMDARFFAFYFGSGIGNTIFLLLKKKSSYKTFSPRFFPHNSWKSPLLAIIRYFHAVPSKDEWNLWILGARNCSRNSSNYENTFAISNVINQIMTCKTRACQTVGDPWTYVNLTSNALVRIFFSSLPMNV